MQTANERLAGLGIRNQIDVLRYTQGELNSIRELLREAEIDLSGKLWRANTEYQKSRLKNMLNAVSQYAREVEAQMLGHSQDALLKFGQQQAGAGFQMLQTAIDKLGLPKGLAIDLNTPDFALIAKAAVANPIHGKLLREWWKEWGTGVRAAVSQQVRLGIAENESIDSIVRRILGTRARNYKDGILAVKRRHAEALVRTSVNSVATQAKNDVYEANSDILEAVEWNSTLDGDTTPICQARDGKRAAIGGRPQTDIPASRRLKPPTARPPAHIGCRSTILPVITDWESLGLENPPPGTRASLDGPVSSDLDYEGWLKTQDKPFIEGVLGKAKTDLFLKGKLSLTKFVDLKGNAYTLADLKRNNPKAWKVAFGTKPKPKPKPKPVPVPVPKPRAAKDYETLESFQATEWADGLPEAFNVGDSDVTTHRLFEILASVPGASKQAAKLSTFMRKYQTGSYFGNPEKTVSKAAFASHQAAFKEWGKGLGKAWRWTAYKLKEELVTPVYNRAMKCGGFTSGSRNYVVSHAGWGEGDWPVNNLAKADAAEMKYSIERVLFVASKQNKKANKYGSFVSRHWQDGSDKHNAIFNIWVHELGHQIHYRAGWPPLPSWMKTGYSKRATQYSYTNSAEFHAEHFVAWLLNREAMLKYNPKLTKYFDDLVDKAIKNGADPMPGYG